MHGFMRREGCLSIMNITDGENHDARADAFVGAKRMSNARIEFFCGTHRAPRSQNI
jgi:hypothetical protein